MTDTEPALDSLLERDPEALLLVDGPGGLVGSPIVGWDGWRGSSYRLAVDPAWRRQGLAGALVRAGEGRLTALGAIRLTAIVAADEAAAMGSWAAIGYERQPRRSRFVRQLSS